MTIKYNRNVVDAFDMACFICGEQAADFSFEHDLAPQKTLLRACGLSIE